MSVQEWGEIPLPSQFGSAPLPLLWVSPQPDSHSVVPLRLPQSCSPLRDDGQAAVRVGRRHPDQSAEESAEVTAMARPAPTADGGAVRREEEGGGFRLLWT